MKDQSRYTNMNNATNNVRSHKNVKKLVQLKIL